MGRIGWVDGAKGIAIVGIVLTHAQALAPSGSPIGRWVLEHLVVALPVLFLVSGVVSAGLSRPSASHHDLALRVLPLLYLYLLWQPVVFAYRLLGTLADGTPPDLVGELARVAAAPIRPNGEIWYLWALAIHLAVLWATRRLPASVVLVPAAALFVFFAGWGRSTLGAELWHVLGPGLQGLPQFAFFTLVGARLAPRIVERVRRAGLGTASVVIAVWLLLGWAHTTAGPMTSGLIGVLQVASGTAATVLVSRWFAERSALVRWIGRWSVVPYLTHTAIIVVVLTVVAAVGGTPLLAAAPDATVLALVVIGSFLALAIFWPVRSSPARFAFAMPQRFCPTPRPGRRAAPRTRRRSRAVIRPHQSKR